MMKLSSQSNKNINIIQIAFGMETVVIAAFIYASIFFLKIYADSNYNEWSLDAGIFGLVLLVLALITFFLLAVPRRATKRGLSRIMKLNLVSAAMVMLMVVQNHVIYSETNVYDVVLIILPIIPAAIIQYWLNKN